VCVEREREEETEGMKFTNGMDVTENGLLAEVWSLLKKNEQERSRLQNILASLLHLVLDSE